MENYLVGSEIIFGFKFLVVIINIPYAIPFSVFIIARSAYFSKAIGDPNAVSLIVFIPAGSSKACTLVFVRAVFDSRIRFKDFIYFLNTRVWKFTGYPLCFLSQ